MFFQFRTVTAKTKLPVCRLWVVEGADEADAREHFAAHVPYERPNLEVFPHDGVVTGSFSQVTARLKEV